ncbi:ADP-ribosylglycohydrolase family protein [Termitidicoccus mucosus]|uniref:ADP-ribosylglycohydrolase n=1 Tax=Termitidicoccus mucosus TaxID=1184151 RepID=A0A178IPU2_9BACT|nr:hypothetical protein AW736_04140 [Opitutaceae bacterium TSB47]
MKPIAQLEERIRACWLGKNIGGTLGGPHEGKPGLLALDFYNPVPQGVLPNDDLDLQVVWMHHLLQGGHRTATPDILAEAWARHVAFPFDEYGIAHRNHAYGLKGAARGAFDNFFAESMGAAIRSEMWACLAPGEPSRAAALARADAVVDHCGDGVLAEVFHAALQSAAFVEAGRERLLETALAFLPAGSRLKRGLLDTRRWWAETADWREVRARVIARYATGNFTDVVCNLCFELLGWLDGGDDFGRALCTAVNCGLDTDCTGATLGALFGIMNPGAIPEKWAWPIGPDVVLSKEILDVPAPANLDTLTEWTLRLRAQLRDFAGEPEPPAPHAPAGENPVAGRIALAEASSADEKILSRSSPPDAAGWRERFAHGHWHRWAAADFPASVRLLKMRFRTGENQSVKLMAFYRPGLTAWVDGRCALVLPENWCAGDVFTAPSFHRAGQSAVVFAAGALPPGEHELIIACRRPERDCAADLVAGLGDPATNQWLPRAFLRSEE